MKKDKPKFYVVWQGRKPGIYLTWEECKAQVLGAEGARYKAFPTIEEAQQAYEAGPELPSVKEKQKPSRRIPISSNNAIIQDAYAVDAACSGNPGQMEYRGVDVKSGIVLFHVGPVFATNNIGEFLAIVHAIALQKKLGTAYPVYSDSRNALLWVKAKKCRTKLPQSERTAKVYELIERAERWLRENDYSEFKILKWR